MIVSGALTLLLAAGSWSSVNLRQFAIYFGLAALTSSLKVPIPGVESTISPNFVFLLLAMVALLFSQLAVISLTAGLMQSLWGSAKRPRLVPVAFGPATLILSGGFAYKFANLILAGSGTQSPVVCVLLAGSIYLPGNAAMAAVVIGLVQGQTFTRVCHHCYERVFPYFMTISLPRTLGFSKP